VSAEVDELTAAFLRNFELAAQRAEFVRGVERAGPDRSCSEVERRHD
jgi:hypothetical protein